MAGTSTKAKVKSKTHKWSDFKKEAERRTAAEGRQRRPPIEPFVIDDVQPPIVILPPDEKTTLVISEQIGILSTGLDPNMSIQRILPLLRAFCGNQFPRVWALLPDEGATEAIYVLMQALMDHFQAALKDAQEASELPGGSGASSD